MNRFDYVKYDEQATIQQAAFKESFQKVEIMASDLKEGRAKSLVMTYLEIAYMWVGKALRDECAGRNPEAKYLPERSKGQFQPGAQRDREIDGTQPQVPRPLIEPC